MAPTTRFEAGDIVLVRFPFTDLSTVKQRPALVLSSEEHQNFGHDVIVAAISGRMSGNPRRFDHPIMAWEGAGLLMPSVVRCAKLVTLERSTVHRILGRLGRNELARVSGLLRQALAM